jgi:hypothetical protein
MARGKAADRGEGARGRGRGGREKTAPPRVGEESLGLYTDCLQEEDRAALAQVSGSGLEQEMAVVRLLIRRAIADGRPAREVAQLLTCLSGLLKTQHVIAGKNAKQLDEALAAALDAIAVEMGIAE